MIVSRYNSRAVVAAVSVVVVLLGCLCPETNAGRAQYSVATATTTVAARDSSPLRRRGGSLSSERRPASGWGGRYATPVQKPPPQSWYRSSSPSAATTSRTKLTVQEEEEEDRQRQQQEAKEAMEAFLTRDSRNSFIGTYSIWAWRLWRPSFLIIAEFLTRRHFRFFTIRPILGLNVVSQIISSRVRDFGGSIAGHGGDHCPVWNESGLDGVDAATGNGCGGARRFALVEYGGVDHHVRVTPGPTSESGQVAAFGPLHSGGSHIGWLCQ